MFHLRYSQHRRRVANVANVCFAGAFAFLSGSALACDPEDEKAGGGEVTFLRHVGDRGPDDRGHAHLADLHRQLAELQMQLDALRNELSHLGGPGALHFAPPPDARRGRRDEFFVTPKPPKMPKSPKMPKMPKFDWRNIPDAPEIRAEVEEHLRELRDEADEWHREHAHEWRERAHEWEEQAREMQEQAREWRHEWQEHKRELAQQMKDQVGEWKEQREEFAREFRDAARDIKEHVRERVREAGGRVRDGKKRANARDGRTRDRGERKERRAERQRTSRGRSGGVMVDREAPGSVTYPVTGAHADLLFDLLAPSNVRVIVSRQVENIAVRGTDDEQAVLNAALQLLGWIERNGVFEAMRQGDSYDKKYTVGPERAELLFDMLAPSDVRVIVAPAGDGAVKVRGTDREHEVLSDFLALLRWDNEEG